MYSSKHSRLDSVDTCTIAIDLSKIAELFFLTLWDCLSLESMLGQTMQLYNSKNES